MKIETTYFDPEDQNNQGVPLTTPEDVLEKPNYEMESHYASIATETGRILNALDAGEPINKKDAFEFLTTFGQEYLRQAFFGAALLDRKSPPPGIDAHKEAATHAQHVYQDMREKYEASQEDLHKMAIKGKIPHSPTQLRYGMYEYSTVLADIVDGKIDLTAYDPIDTRITRALLFFRTAHEMNFSRQQADTTYREKPGNKLISAKEAAFYNRLLAGLHTNPTLTRDEQLAEEEADLRDKEQKDKLQRLLSDIDIPPLPDKSQAYIQERAFIKNLTRDITMYPVVIYRPPVKVTLPDSYYERYHLERPLEPVVIQKTSERLLNEAGIIIDFTKKVPTHEEEQLQKILDPVDIPEDFAT